MIDSRYFAQVEWRGFSKINGWLGQGARMRTNIFWAGVLVWVAVAAALGQDPTKVEPRHYHLDFENDKVQVVSVHYGPHEKSALHEHPGGVVVVLTEAHLRFTDENGKTRDVYSKPGEARWYPPFKHRVENLGDTPYDAVYVGVKSKATATNGPDPNSEQEAKRIVGELLGSAPKQ
jgi:beta-alanine degradation protein BauB